MNLRMVFCAVTLLAIMLTSASVNGQMRQMATSTTSRVQTLSTTSNVDCESSICSKAGATLGNSSRPSIHGGHTYYVDNTVLDTFIASSKPDCATYDPATYKCGNGNSLAYSTIADINTVPLQSGDTVLFRRGETWREQLTDQAGAAGYSGSATAPVTLGAFGSPASPLPVISGANLVTTWAPEVVSNGGSAGTVYSSHYQVIDGCGNDECSTPYANTPTQMFEDGHRLNANTSGYSSLLPGQWYLDTSNSTIWVRLTGDDAPESHVVEASQRDFSILLSEQSYIVISSLEVAEANEDGIAINIGYGNGWNHDPVANHHTIIGVVAINNYSEGILTQWSGNDVISSCVAAYNGRIGIRGYMAPSLLIEENTVFDNVQLYVQPNAATGPTASGIKLEGNASTNVIIQKNVVYSNGRTATLATASGIGTDSVGPGYVAEFNNSYSNTRDGIELDGTNGAAVHDNLSYKNGRMGVYAFPEIPAGGLRDNQIFNNTVIGNYSGGIVLNGFVPAASWGCMNNSVVNNIAVDTVAGPNLQANAGCENPGNDGYGNVYAYNSFGPEKSKFIAWGNKSTATNTLVFESTYAAWEAAQGNCGTVGCTHSMELDPLLSDASNGNLTLSPSSPAIGAGTPLGHAFQYGLNPSSNWPFNVLLDVRSGAGQGWPIGAFGATVGGEKAY